MADADDDTEVHPTLVKLAKLLEVPLARFFDPPKAEADGPLVQEHEAELLRLFRQIEDPYVRARCLDFLRAAAKEPTEG